MGSVGHYCMLDKAKTGNPCGAVFKDDPSCSDDVIDACGTDFIVFAKGPEIPDTPEKLAESCKQELKSADCTKDYTTQCLLGFTRGAALVAVNAAVEELEGKCDTTHAAHKRYFKHVKCMNRAGEKIHGCVKRFQEDLYGAAHGAPPKLKIPYACCQYHDFYKCCEEALAEHCRDPDAIELMHETTDNVFGNMLSIICGPYQKDSTQCLSLDALPRYSNFTAAKNFISPLKAIVKSLG
ncbi:hypothetical protein HPB52_003866 [Rhipicephalus sanguineus]|uniref:Uncharacterized protein n=1 Tax=Rhipicephalus sanguineus TaxID=34632 RepID=A0A9D4T3S9_RHISA|nr:hypothetical protein HPB52_003866 [Rhipicephalus sanguineus]